ncbi:MAG: bacteriohemerythrin [Halobacteriovoraceae bacterium]|nr:bacteriohemerythrin [Halobacteriovoraceae bacterium]
MDFQKFEWSEELSIGVDQMDQQHKNLVNKINLLIEDINCDSPNILKDFQELGRFVVEHFNDEEIYMESIEFPNLEIHKNIHKQLLEKVGEYGQSIESGNLDKGQLINFLKMWLKSHIMGIDMKYGEHAKKIAA